MKKALKNATDFFCKDCDFTCSKKYDWDRHIMTRKHHNRTNLEQNGVKSAQHHSYVCNKCNKKYSARNSLWYHEKKCAEEENLNVSNASHEQIQIAHPPTNELVVSLLNQNMELQKQIIELCKEKNTVINNNTTKSN